MPKEEVLSAAGVEWVLNLVESDYASIAAGQAATGVLEVPEPMSWVLPKLEASAHLQDHPPELRRMSAENACRHAVESGVLRGAWGGIAQSLRYPGSDTSAVRSHKVLSADPDPLRQMLSHTVGLVEKADRGERLSGAELQALKVRNKEFLATDKTYGPDDEQLHTAVYEALVDRFDFLVDDGQEKTAAAPYRRILESMGAKIEVLPPVPSAESTQEARTRVRVPTPWGSRRAAAVTAVAAAAAVTLTGNAVASAKTPDTPPKPAPVSRPAAAPTTHTEPRQAPPTGPKTTAPAAPPAAPVKPKQPPAEAPQPQAPPVTSVQNAPQPSAGSAETPVVSVNSSTAPEKVVTIVGDTASTPAGNTQQQATVSVVPGASGASPIQPEGATPPAAATVISTANPNVAPQIADTNTGGVDPVRLAAANDLTDFYKEHGNTLNVASALTEAYIAKGVTPAADSTLTQNVTTTVTGLGLNDPGTEPNQAGVNAILQAEFPDQNISTAPPASQPATKAAFTSVVADSLTTDTSNGLTDAATTEGVSTTTVQSIANSLAQAAADVTPQPTQESIVAAAQGQSGDGAGQGSTTGNPGATAPAPGTTPPTPSTGAPSPAPSTPAANAPKPTAPPQPSAPKQPKHEQGSSQETSKTQAQINRLVKFGVPAQYAALYVKYGNMYAAEGISPEFLAAQGKQESGYNPTALSPAGAMGISQFMPATWNGWKKTLGFPDSASPYDPDYAIHAQAAMMANLRREVAHLANGKQTVTQLSLAAYNAGAGNVEKFGGIPPFKETQAYVPDILSIFQQIVKIPLQTASGQGQQPPAPKTGNTLPASVKLASQSLGYARFVAKVPDTPSASGHDVFFVDQADLQLDGINTGDACGLTTAVGVVSSLLKTSPNQQLITKIHQDLENIGEYTDDPNTGGIQDQGEGLLKYLHDTYGFNVSTILHEKSPDPTSDAVMAQVREALDQNKAGKPTLIIVHTSDRVDGSQGNSPQNNTNGHYFYMYAYDNNGYYVANVGAAADTSPQGKAYTRDEIKGWIDGFYVVSQ